MVLPSLVQSTLVIGKFILTEFKTGSENKSNHQSFDFKTKNNHRQKPFGNIYWDQEDFFRNIEIVA